MTLVSKIRKYGALTALAASSVFYGGCATGDVEFHPEVLGKAADNIVNDVVHNAPYIAGQVIAQTNPNLTQGQAAVLYSASNAAMQANIARENSQGQNTIIEQQIYPSIRRDFMSSYEFDDLNGNHVVDSMSEVGPEKREFFDNEGIVFEFTNNNHFTGDVKLLLLRDGKVAYETGWIPRSLWGDAISIDNVGKRLAGPGIYEAVIINGKNEVYGKETIEVKKKYSGNVVANDY